MTLPTNINKDEIADKFAEFFTDKVTKIWSDLDKKTLSIWNEDSRTATKLKENILNQFQPASVDKVKQIIMNSLSKSCSRDTLPTSFMKQCVDILLPIITDIVNTGMSIASSCISSSMKEAIVTPLLTKTSLDPNQLKNYRPVSSLCFTSKVMEKIVAARLSHHMQSHNLYETKQSAYRKCQSTETALLRIHSDLLTAADSHRALCLMLLDSRSSWPQYIADSSIR